MVVSNFTWYVKINIIQAVKGRCQNITTFNCLGYFSPSICHVLNIVSISSLKMVIAASCFFGDQQNVVYTYMLYMFCTNLVKTDACQNTNIFLFDIHGGIMREDGILL